MKTELEVPCLLFVDVFLQSTSPVAGIMNDQVQVAHSSGAPSKCEARMLLADVHSIIIVSLVDV